MIRPVPEKPIRIGGGPAYPAEVPKTDAAVPWELAYWNKLAEFAAETRRTSILAGALSRLGHSAYGAHAACDACQAMATALLGEPAPAAGDTAEQDGQHQPTTAPGRGGYVWRIDFWTGSAYEQHAKGVALPGEYETAQHLAEHQARRVEADPESAGAWRVLVWPGNQRTSKRNEYTAVATVTSRGRNLARDLATRGLTDTLLGCEWGRTISLPDNQEVCIDRAVQRVALHNGPHPALVQLCADHRDLVIANTNPHAPTPPASPEAAPPQTA